MSAADLNNDYERVPKASDVLKATHEGMAIAPWIVWEKEAQFSGAISQLSVGAVTG